MRSRKLLRFAPELDCKGLGTVRAPQLGKAVHWNTTGAGDELEEANAGLGRH